MRSPIVSLLAVAAVLLLATPAAAHVTIAQPEHTAGSFTVLTFSVGHGCEGSPTTELAIRVPEPILDVTPEDVPGWEVEIQTEALEVAEEGAHGEEVAEREAVVVYTGRLEDGLRRSFDIGLFIPEDVEGELYWPVLQTCEEGEHRWVRIPAEGQDPHELDEPAPSITVVPGDGDGHGHGDADGHDDGHDEATEGDASVTTAAAGGDDQADEDVADEPTEIGTALASTSDGGTDVLTVLALLAGVAGLGFGLAGYRAARAARG